jgi:amino acid adenylation domain-containing protein
VTLYMVLLAAFQTLHARWSGQDEEVEGTYSGNRPRRELEGLVGFFVNTLVLRTSLEEDPAFAAFLERVRETTLGAYAHADLPFEKLLESLEVERDPSRTPLFQALLVLHNFPPTRVELSTGGRLSSLASPGENADFDLELSLGEVPHGISGFLVYSASLFDEATMARFAAQLRVLLEAAAAEPGTPVSELRLMDAEEERELLQCGLDRSGRTWVPPVTVHDLFLQQAGRTPGRIAAIGPQGTLRTLTYGELAERSSALAGRIQAVLPRPLDRPVALLADADPLVLAGMLGILQAGAGFVPLDPRHPEERLAWMLQDAACEVLVTQRRHFERAERLGVRHVLCLEDAVPSGPEPAILAASEPRSLAYIVYTSGSTGRPKGVQVSHENLVPILLWGIETLGLSDSSRVLQSLSFCFDFGIFEHLTTLLAGGTLVYPGEAAGDPLAFAREIVRQSVDTLHTTPALARELATAGVELDSLQILHLGGEALSRDTVARLRRAAPRAVLYNGYGPTEATVNSSIYRIGGRIGGRIESDDSPWPIVPIGRPSADNALYILDRAGRPVPFGVRGDLHVGGIGVTRGYLNRPDLTAERFVPDPFGSAAGGRLYRTGDLVRALPGGDVEFLGRLDHQVKIRGFRIETGEIEATLSRHPQVAEAVVTVREDGGGSPSLAAYVVPATVRPTVDGLRSFLAERLPAYMVPAFWVLLDALPLTANGKVDLRALPAPEHPHGDPGTYLAPRDILELRLVRIWEDLLGAAGPAGPPIGVRDDFFALGGHSLLAVRLVARIEQSLGSSLPVAALLRSPTVEGLAALLRDGAEPSRGPLVELAAGPRDRYPLFLVHPVGGEVLAYLPLARDLAAERSVYGLQASGESRTLEEMAAAYLDAMRAVQPTGPYRLGGWSLGGVVAFEMARQLEAAGETVDLVALLDSYAPGAAEKLPDDAPEALGPLGDPSGEAGLVALFAHDLARLLGLTGLAVPPWGAESTASAALGWLAAEATRLGLLPAGVAERELARRFAVFAANHRAMAAYRGGSCAAPILLLKAGEAPATAAPDLGWSLLLRRPIEVQQLPGDHYTLLQPPQVKLLSSLLRGVLQQIDG